SAEESKFEPQLSAGRLNELEGIVIFRSSGDCQHIQAILNPQVMNMMPRMVSYLLFPLDTWVITKHLQNQLDALALNRFRRDEQSCIAMVGRQITVSSQLAGPNDLVALTSHELEEQVRLVAEECVSLRREENATPKRVKGSNTGPLADPSPIKGSAAVYKARSKVPAGRHLMVSSEDEVGGQGVVTLRTGSDDDREGLFAPGGETLMVPSSEVSGPPTREMPTIKVVYGKGALLSLPGEPAALTSSAPNFDSKMGAGSGAVCPREEIVKLSGGAPRLKSRLSSSLPVPMKCGRKADSSKGKESPVGKRSRAAPSSDTDDDEATLTLMRRKRSAHNCQSMEVGQDKSEKSHSCRAPRGRQPKPPI
ncbi:hypothetical protein PanWU01x14_100520, partial [Parasponia andersonii]